MVKRFAIFLVLAAAMLAGCNDFQKLQKSVDLNMKYDKAVEYYNKGDFTKAQILFDELYSVFRSTDKAESVAYYLAYCDFKTGDYIMASYLFRTYFRTYPTSPRASECLYMSAYCHYLVSPPYSLDQEDTYSAIEEFQYFIQMFPTDTARIGECNKMVDNLHKKLEKKAFLNAKLYYDIEDYKAAITSLGLFNHDYPDSHYKEESDYLIAMSKYYLALNSIDAKKAERVQDCIDACNDFLTKYKESEYTGDVKMTLEKAKKLQMKLSNDNKINSNQK
ncbi:MAG TPA: outer membrane protein assembly factor BamD [Bacteroidia bacterium]|nr:outer membrane protein assembly factor BamD [Bacteroidia bacterium]